MQRVDRAIDAGPGLLRVVGHQLGHVFQRQRHAVHALDDAVVEVLADPVALFDHREPSDRLVQPRVLDGDAGVQREELVSRWSSSLNSSADSLSVR